MGVVFVLRVVSSGFQDFCPRRNTFVAVLAEYNSNLMGVVVVVVVDVVVLVVVVALICDGIT